MYKKSHLLLILCLCLSLIPTSARFFYYEYKFANSKYLTGDSMIDSEETSRFPTSEAIKYLKSHPNQKIFTFRQSDLLTFRESNWIDNFDPRAKAFLEARSVRELFELLKRNEISFVLVPNYSWPTIYNSYFQDLLGDPKYSTPLIETIDTDPTVEQYQLYKIEERSVTKTCRQTNILTEEFYGPAESIQVRLFYYILGVPATIQSGLSKIDVKKKKTFTNFTTDKKLIFRSLNRSITWYDDDSAENSSKQVIIRVKLKSDSLVSLKVQGLGNRSTEFNIPKFGRIINVAEDLDAQGNIEIVSQILKSEKVGELKLFLSATGGADLVKGNIELEICSVKVLEEKYENPVLLQNRSRLGDPTLIRINLFDCDLNSICKIRIGKEASDYSRFQSFRKSLKNIYQLTAKLYSPFKVVSDQMADFFNYVPSDLELYKLKCLEVCPTEGRMYVYWTNSYGFPNRLVVSDISQDLTRDLSVYLPNLREFKDVELRFEKSEVGTADSSVYELRRYVS